MSIVLNLPSHYIFII